MAGKSFLTRLEEANTLQSSIEDQADGVGADLEEMFRPVLREGETMPDMGLAVRLLGRVLGLRRDELKASAARAKELEGQPPARRELLAAFAELRGHVISFRKLTDGPIGPGTVKKVFGLTGRTPRNVAELELVVERLLEQLRDPELQLPPTFPAVKVFPRKWIPILEPSLRRLQDAREAADGETWEGIDALSGKQVDQEAYDEYFKPLGWAVKGLYYMTGRIELFKKLRLGARKRSGKKKSPVAEPASGSDEGSAG